MIDRGMSGEVPTFQFYVIISIGMLFLNFLLSSTSLFFPIRELTAYCIKHKKYLIIYIYILSFISVFSLKKNLM